MDNYAGPVRRVLAYLIDFLIVILVLKIILRPGVSSGLFDMRVLVISVVFVIYEALMVYYIGSTAGKFVMGIRVADYVTHEKPSLTQCFSRPWIRLFFGLLIIKSVIIGFIGLLFWGLNIFKMFTNEDHRAIHDGISGTIALKAGRQFSKSNAGQTV